MTDIPIQHDCRYKAGPPLLLLLLLLLYIVYPLCNAEVGVSTTDWKNESREKAYANHHHTHTHLNQLDIMYMHTHITPLLMSGGYTWTALMDGLPKVQMKRPSDYLPVLGD